MTYNEALIMYKTKYELTKAVSENKVFKIEKGFYSETKYYNQLEYISKKYPQIIFTNQSTYFYLGLTDYIPDKYYIATKCRARKIVYKDIKQVFEQDKYFSLGKTKININGIDINVYNKEKMLIELVRNKNIYSYDYYKELITSYRNIVNDIDMDKIMNYLEVYPFGNIILERLNMEIF